MLPRLAADWYASRALLMLALVLVDSSSLAPMRTELDLASSSVSISA